MNYTAVREGEGQESERGQAVLLGGVGKQKYPFPTQKKKKNPTQSCMSVKFES